MSSTNRYQSSRKLHFLRNVLERTQAPSSWVEKEFAFGLWFGFLGISPSYELATRHRIDGLNDFERNLLPPDFDRVLAVYDDLGPVRSLNFLGWWPSARARNFGTPGWRPEIIPLGTLASQNDAQYLAQMITFLGGGRPDSMIHNAAMLAVPLDQPKRLLMRQFSELIDKLQPKAQKRDLPPPKYHLARKRQDNSSLMRYLDLFWKRSVIAKPLWRVGYEAGFSSTYTNLIGKKLREDQEPTADQKERLKILTSRGLARAWMIAENAARGIFPSYAKCAGAVSLKDMPMYDIVREQNRAGQLTGWLELYPKFYGSD